MVDISHSDGATSHADSMSHTNPTDEALRAIVENSRAIAIVGASSNPKRPSYGVMKRLLDAGFDVIPVNPREKEVHGMPAFNTLADVPMAIDIVDVFRPAETTPAIADEAVAANAKVFWLQLGISNDDAAARAEAAGLTVVMDKCLGDFVARNGIRRR